MNKTRTIIENKQSELGQTTRFGAALERGEGDTIVDAERYWGDATVREFTSKS